jgi:hypothetical protein
MDALFIVEDLRPNLVMRLQRDGDSNVLEAAKVPGEKSDKDAKDGSDRGKAEKDSKDEKDGEDTRKTAQQDDLEVGRLPEYYM